MGGDYILCCGEDVVILRKTVMRDMKEIKVIKGDITALAVDAIVNAANRSTAQSTVLPAPNCWLNVAH